MPDTFNPIIHVISTADAETAKQYAQMAPMYLQMARAHPLVSQIIAAMESANLPPENLLPLIELIAHSEDTRVILRINDSDILAVRLSVAD